MEINMERYDISSECFYFVNPGELHSISVEKEGEARENAVVFHPEILSFQFSDQIESRLIQPIQSGSLFFPRCITSEHPAFPKILEAFQAVTRAFACSGDEGNARDVELVTEDITSQLFIKSALLQILGVLSSYNLFTETERNRDRRIETIKATLTYIQENYKEKIYVRDLAGLIGMNEQYFCRFFKKVLGRSPMEYVNAYRIKKATHYLKETDLTVTEVCLECGFNNLGNFLREFRKYTSTTPLQYQKKHAREGFSGVTDDHVEKEEKSKYRSF